MESLTEKRIQQAMDEACRCTQERWVSASQQGLSLHRISTKDDWDSLLPIIHNIQSITTEQSEQIFGIFVTLDSTCIGFCTFYFAYSTWDGRVIFLDRFHVVDVLDSSQISINALNVSLSLRYTVADIGLKLECTRFVWQHFADSAPPHPNIQPETLHEWLTIHMDREAMISLVKNGCMHPSDQASSGSTIRAVITRCLEDNDRAEGTSKLHLRLATVDDLAIVERLVQGLAHFEKMPDAIHVTQDHYRRDGFPTNTVDDDDDAHPLFYCILLEDHKTSYACGMAFIYVAHSLSLGRFVYLEDLFIEEEFRGLGGGKAAMEALARVCLALDCDKFVWQALDWNTPALNFYAKLGGRVCEGLLTSRFAGESLNEFCKQRPVGY